ncbi:hypothetical protein AAMO2058_000478400 [Amorphochlora amoebiformis]
MRCVKGTQTMLSQGGEMVEGGYDSNDIGLFDAAVQAAKTLKIDQNIKGDTIIHGPEKKIGSILDIFESLRNAYKELPKGSESAASTRKIKALTHRWERVTSKYLRINHTTVNHTLDSSLLAEKEGTQGAVWIGLPDSSQPVVIRSANIAIDFVRSRRNTSLEKAKETQKNSKSTQGNRRTWADIKKERRALSKVFSTSLKIKSDVPGVSSRANSPSLSTRSARSVSAASVSMRSPTKLAPSNLDESGVRSAVSTPPDTPKGDLEDQDSKHKGDSEDNAEDMEKTTEAEVKRIVGQIRREANEETTQLRKKLGEMEEILRISNARAKKAEDKVAEMSKKIETFSATESKQQKESKERTEKTVEQEKIISKLMKKTEILQKCIETLNKKIAMYSVCNRKNATSRRKSQRSSPKGDISQSANSSYSSVSMSALHQKLTGEVPKEDPFKPRHRRSDPDGMRPWMVKKILGSHRWVSELLGGRIDDKWTLTEDGNISGEGEQGTSSNQNKTKRSITGTWRRKTCEIELTVKLSGFANLVYMYKGRFQFSEDGDVSVLLMDSARQTIVFELSDFERGSEFFSDTNSPRDSMLSNDDLQDAGSPRKNIPSPMESKLDKELDSTQLPEAPKPPPLPPSVTKHVDRTLTKPKPKLRPQLSYISTMAQKGESPATTPRRHVSTPEENLQTLLGTSKPRLQNTLSQTSTQLIRSVTSSSRPIESKHESDYEEDFDKSAHLEEQKEHESKMLETRRKEQKEHESKMLEKRRKDELKRLKRIAQAKQAGIEALRNLVGNPMTFEQRVDSAIPHMSINPVRKSSLGNADIKEVILALKQSHLFASAVQIQRSMLADLLTKHVDTKDCVLNIWSLKGGEMSYSSWTKFVQGMGGIECKKFKISIISILDDITRSKVNNSDFVKVISFCPSLTPFALRGLLLSIDFEQQHGSKRGRRKGLSIPATIKQVQKRYEQGLSRLEVEVKMAIASLRMYAGKLFGSKVMKLSQLEINDLAKACLFSPLGIGGLACKGSPTEAIISGFVDERRSFASMLELIHVSARRACEHL